MIFLLCDHAGFELKEFIKNKLCKEKLDIVDIGAFKLDEGDDFSSYIGVLKKTFDPTKKKDRIIALCGSGVGMCIGLNKIKGVRCVVGHSEEEVNLARAHNDVNALSLGGRVTSKVSAGKMVKAFLETDTLGGKYKKRMDEIEIK